MFIISEVADCLHQSKYLKLMPENIPKERYDRKLTGLEFHPLEYISLLSTDLATTPNPNPMWKDSAYGTTPNILG